MKGGLSSNHSLIDVKFYFNMSNIMYRETTRTQMNDGFSAELKEAAEFFNEQGIQMTGAGFDEILAESQLFAEYKNRLTQSLPADQQETFGQLMENARLSMLQEASVSGVQQIAGLAMPTIRKMWAKIALKHAIPTEVVKTPRFSISYTKAYIIDGETGERHELPDAINDLSNNKAEMKKLDVGDITFTGNAANVVLFEKMPSGAGAYIPVANHDSIDKNFWLETVTLDGVDTPVRVHVKSDIHANIYCQVSGKNASDEVVSDTIFGKIDYDTSVLELACMNGKVKSVTVLGRLSQELNEQGDSVSFDVLTKDVVIGVGTHINAPLPIEWLQDTMAIYNIDGAAEVVDLMSQTVAQKLELEIYNFLVNSLEVNNVPYIGEFDIIPSAGYAGPPKAWREELKTVVDHYALRIKRDSKFHQGKFVLIGSPIDMALIPNVDWVFNHSNEEMGGVEVGFNLGAYSGANRYELVSSDLVPDGQIIMIFIPGIDRLMTYKYFPYTFNVEKGYRDPNFQNVPSIMVTKRHTIEEFTPLIAKINILHNGADSSFRLPSTAGY